MQKLAAKVNTGEVKQSTMKSDRGSILTARKQRICMEVIKILAAATMAHVFQVYWRGVCPTLMPLPMNQTPKTTICSRDLVVRISPGDTGWCLAR